MPNHFVGKNRTELTDWLLQTWLKEGPPVCFVEGFSGVGKTSVARSVIANCELSQVVVEMPYANSDQADNLFLNLATELSGININDLADTVTEGKSTDQALGAILNRPILIVIDEFQRAMDESGKPTSSLINFLGRLSNHPNILGRVLLLTNRIVERSKWSEAYTIRTLTGLSPEDAEDLLGKLLNDAKRDDEIPQERRRDVVNWLGCNPRAIYVLVASLEKSSLDELIGLNPEIWEARDREVSPELLHKLETELLERTIELLLKPETTALLRRLSVHRKSVQRDAIEKLLPKGAKYETVRDDLINRFLMEQHSGWFSLNPVVREISLQNLKEKPSDLRQAHFHAADHYMRHFKAKEIVDSGKLGSYFVEARYHLVQAQRDEELGQIAMRFESHLKARFSSTSPVPRQLDELNERIATLMALLETPGAKGLEYYLARLYEARGAPGDMRKALVNVERATGKEAPVGSWVLRLRLEAKINGPAQIGLLAREGITRVPSDKGVEQIYFAGAELLAQADRIDEAISLLKDGITKIPVESLSQLYTKTADLLAQVGRSGEAITLLKEGIVKIPIESVNPLYTKTADLLAQAGKSDEAISLLKDGITKIPVESLFQLYPKTADLLAQSGKNDEAISLLKDGITNLPVWSSFVFYPKLADLLAQAGKSDEAIALLKGGITKIPVESLSQLYTKTADLLAQSGKSDEAIVLLKDGITKIPVESLSQLYTKTADLLAQSGKSDEAITLLKEGITKIPVESVNSLYPKTADLLAQSGKSDEAISLLKEGIAKLPVESVYLLYTKTADLLAQSGKSDEAISLLKDGIVRVSVEGLYLLYPKTADLLAQSGKNDEAIALLKDGITRVPLDKGRFILQQYAENLTINIGNLEDLTLLSILPTGQEIFISYAWGGESEKLVNNLDQAFQNRGVTMVRDKRDLGFKGRIKGFMETIGKGKAVILIISEKYLKSENCLFELLQIEKHGDFEGRIFPIVLDDARIYKAVDRIRYVQFWEQQLKELDDAMKTVSATNMQGFREDIDLYAEIRASLSRLTDILKDMNTLTPTIHQDAAFQTLFDTVMAKLEE